MPPPNTPTLSTMVPSRRPFNTIDDIPAGHKTILLVGKSKAGKSTFINDLIGYPVMEAGRGDSVTREMSFVTTTVGGEQVAMVDTVGFGGSDEDLQMTEILKELIGKLATENDEPTIRGIIFLASMTSRPFSANDKGDLKIFEKIIGRTSDPEAMQNVFFVTSRWLLENHDDFKDMEADERDLKNRQWAGAMGRGARVHRLDMKAPGRNSNETDKKQKYQANALRIVNFVLASPSPRVLGAQAQMRGSDENAPLYSRVEAVAEFVEQQNTKIAAVVKFGGDPKLLQDNLEKFKAIKVGDLRTKEQRFAFAKAKGNEAFSGSFVGRAGGRAANLAGELTVGVLGTVGGKRGRAIEEAYPGMVSDAAESTNKGMERGEKLFGEIPLVGKPIGRAVGGTLGLCKGMANNVVRGLGKALDA